MGNEVLTRAAVFQPETFDADRNTVHVIFSTGADVRRRDIAGDYIERLSLAPEAVDLSQFRGAPVLNDATLADAAEAVVRGELKLNIPLIGIAKGPDRDRNDIITHETDPEKRKVYQQYLPLLVRVRDEAHRFAITHHRKLRGKQTLIARPKGE